MPKYYQVPKPFVVDAVQFRKNKPFPKHDLYEIHKYEDKFIIRTHINYQAIVNDKDWIINQKDGIIYVMSTEHFKLQFKKVVDVKKTDMKVIDA